MSETRITQFKEMRDIRSDSSVDSDEIVIDTASLKLPPSDDDGLKRTVSIQESQVSINTTVFDVAAYILHTMGKLSTIKLQKLVYYSQAWSLVWDDKPLFQERIEAWINGPVVPELFFLHKGLFIVDNDIMPIGNFRNIGEEQRKTIDAVIEYYGNKTAQWLVELSHSEDPWVNARAGLKAGEKGNRVISFEDMAMYYGGL